MKTNEYIASGILELYAMGILSAEEKAEVALNIDQYPELKKELDHIEHNFQLLAERDAIAPNEATRDILFEKLGLKRDEPLTLEVGKVRVNFYAYALAACFILLIISFLATYNLWTRLQKTEKDYYTLLNEQRGYSNQVAFYKNEMDKSYAILHDPKFKTIFMKGTPAHVASEAFAFWNPEAHAVMLSPNKLPANDASHQYQLWAIVKGKPLSAGVFDVKSGYASILIMKDVIAANAFAVTLEPKGGSATPHLDQMFVMAGT